MLKFFAELPPRKRIGIIAVILGLLSIFAGNPYNKSKVKINLEEISKINEEDIANLSIQKLADKIIKNEFDYRLIDLRKSSDYNEYNIPTSENVTVNNLLSYDIEPTENIILYSDNDIIPTQAWFILKSNNFNGVSVLKGGIKTWRDEILFPVCNCGENPSKEQEHKHSKLAEISKFFGGKIVVSSNSSTKDNLELPKVKAPEKISLKKSKVKRKREGC